MGEYEFRSQTPNESSDKKVGTLPSPTDNPRNKMELEMKNTEKIKKFPS
jgi:hypothetical protein